ncbi:hypothetical protein [Paenibacillus rigui]|uniref:Uncharacterized protein n=1 Tax=Paenibacillus rigui TaxID=554312 RepID=A0A229UL12_9BACL|nr:hypothetical protein [Paenibacillus rigui]OXM83994.1 hypothetical protein CF651_23060 [Paenibacillus rigui]
MRKFVIACTRHNDLYFGGNAVLFWGPNSSGYTACLESAGLYSEEEAVEKGKGTHGQDIPIPIEMLGMGESFFVSVETGLKEVSRITLFNKHNEANKAILNECRKLYC